VGIFWCGLLKYPGQSLPERMQVGCQWRAVAAIPFDSILFQQLNRAQGSLDESRFTALSRPNFTRMVVLGHRS
jgi:hypothetical protein